MTLLEVFLVFLAGVLLIANSGRIARNHPFRRVPVLRTGHWLWSRPAIILAGTGWIALGVWGLLDR
jgi:hypothetical protein